MPAATKPHPDDVKTHSAASKANRAGGHNAVTSQRAEFVQSIARGFAVIKAFAGKSEPLTIADIARHTQLSRAVSRRFLLTFEQLGYIVKQGGGFRLTPRVLDLGYAFLSTMRLPEVALPIMEQVVASVHESCSVSILEGRDVLYVARVPANRIMSVALAVGARLPAYPTSMGRVLLAALDPSALDRYLAEAPFVKMTDRTVTSAAELRRLLARVRDRGWASVDQEMELGVRSVAAPIRDRSGRTIAAINISSHALRVNLKELRGRHLPMVLDAADRISALLGAPPKT